MDIPCTRLEARQAEAREFLARETCLLVSHRWREWAELFTEDGVLWAPSWVSHACPSTEPELEISLLHCRGTLQLAERVQRALSGASPACSTLPRLWRSTSDILVTADRGAVLAFEATWASALLDAATGRTSELRGRSQYVLEHDTSTWRLSRKTVFVFTHPLPPVVDFYRL